jgi:hypothetical protein
VIVIGHGIAEASDDCFRDIYAAVSTIDYKTLRPGTE